MQAISPIINNSVTTASPIALTVFGSASQKVYVAQFWRYGAKHNMVLIVNFAGIESTSANGIARLLPLQTYVSEVGSLHPESIVSAR